MDEGKLRKRIEEVVGSPPSGRMRVFADTSSYMSITAGDVIRLGGRHYYVYGEESEGRFGIDDQPKLWVKRARDLESGERKILKLGFFESFRMDVGGAQVSCFRSPTKEARILEATRDDPSFMTGSAIEDDEGNLVRVVDRIRGVSVYNRVRQASSAHDDYFRDEFPGLFVAVLDSVRAIARLHADGEIHGDIRNDHLWLDRSTGDWRWIDFDYAYEWTENPFGVDLYGLGNILLYTAGKGFYTTRNVATFLPPEVVENIRLQPEDFSLFFAHRIMNLGKLFPYVPHSLNRVLLRFAHEAEVLYTDTSELVADLEGCLGDLGAEEGQ